MISFKTGASSNYIKGYCQEFGDSEEFLRTVLKCSNEVFEIYEDGVFCGGACVLDVSIVNNYTLKTGAYIYGAFICEKMRGKGLFRQLCAHIHEHYVQEFYDFILTIPASEDLFPLYERLGFSMPVYGSVSMTPRILRPKLPADIKFREFDGNYNDLYLLHISSKEVIKDFDFFVASVEDFDIKYIYHGDEKGYAIFRNGRLIFVSASFAEHIVEKKGLICPITDDFFVPDGLLCDFLFEV